MERKNSVEVHYLERVCKIALPGHWITAKTLEQILQRTQSLLICKDLPVIVRFHKRCKIMVDAAVQLLSLTNQLVAQNRSITFVFDGIWNDAMGYLGRANFFSLLSEHVKVVPARPDPTIVAQYQGSSR